MGERRWRDRLDVVEHDEVAPRERRPAARELEQRETAARARADGDALRLPRRRHDVDAVAAHTLGDVHLLERLLHLEERLPVDDRRQLDVVRPPLDAAGEHVDLVVAGGVAERGAQQEPVELRLGQRIRALVLDRVLRRDDEERRPEPVRRPFDRHLPLLHPLEERGLRLRWGAVDLVGEEQVREDRARPELEVAVALVPDGRARDVRRHQVRRELDARELHAERAGERTGGERLGEARVVLEQDVAVREEPEQGELERVALADDRPLDLVEHPARRAPGGVRAPSVPLPVIRPRQGPGGHC